MRVTHIGLLETARRLHDIPRGPQRFKEYLATITGELADDLALPPLVAMNPMGRAHVAARLDQLIALGAEDCAAAACAEAAERLGHIDLTLRHGLTLCDNQLGGWTNRWTSEAGLWLAGDVTLRHDWVMTPLWVSDEPAAGVVRQEVLRTLARTAERMVAGPPTTLAAMLRQEGTAAAFAGMEPHLADDDLAYTQAVLAPLRETTHYPTCFAAMYGDSAAREVGYPPLGLSPRAGFALGLAEALGKLT